MSHVGVACGRHAWVTVPATFYFELQGAPLDHELDKFDFRVGGRFVETTPTGGLVLDIDAFNAAAGNVTRLTPRPGVTSIPREKIRRIDVVARLSEKDLDAPFRYHLGDEVTVLRDAGNSGSDLRGVIVEGTCEYQPGREGGSCREPSYEIKRPDGSTLCAREMQLARHEGYFVNVRDAARIIRDWIRPTERKAVRHASKARAS